MNDAPRVLHVVESYGGGVADAVASFAESTPHFEHHLLYATRVEAPISRESLATFATAERYVNGHVRRIRQTRRHADRLRPTLVHAHSSFGGAYARIAVRSPRVPVVYTPHCYAFERTDSGKVTTTAFLAAEWALSRNTSVVAACSPREADLARRLHKSATAIYVPNVARVSTTIPAGERNGSGITVVGAGRVAAQKDSGAFALVARQMSRVEGVSFRWLGGGEPRREQELTDAGVEVTGWLNKADLVTELSKADVYVHTAAWEGFPVGLLEAVALGVPSLVLDRPYARGIDRTMVCSDISDLAGRIALLINDLPARDRLVDTGRESFAMNVRAEQSRLLHAVYATAQGGAYTKAQERLAS